MHYSSIRLAVIIYSPFCFSVIFRMHRMQYWAWHITVRRQVGGKILSTNFQFALLPILLNIGSYLNSSPRTVSIAFILPLTCHLPNAQRSSLTYFLHLFLFPRSSMPNGNNSARLRKATSRFDKNVVRTISTNSASRKKEEEGYGLGPIVIAFFAFVVIGSSLLEMFRPNA